MGVTMTGWIVASVLYILAAMWVPITLQLADGVGRRPKSFFHRFVVPVLLTIFWPIALGVAIGEWWLYR
jgi:predicted Na+-dependent transporter